MILLNHVPAGFRKNKGKGRVINTIGKLATNPIDTVGFSTLRVVSRTHYIPFTMENFGFSSRPELWMTHGSQTNNRIHF